jgi:hypothetical protein
MLTIAAQRIKDWSPPYMVKLEAENLGLIANPLH